MPRTSIGESLWRGAFNRLRRSPMAIMGAGIMAIFVLVAIFAPVLAPYEPASTEWTELSTHCLCRRAAAVTICSASTGGVQTC
ncbi:MAG: hypothetical protein WKF82_00635 [Nocardioidaceae bacterium]